MQTATRTVIVLALVVVVTLSSGCASLLVNQYNQRQHAVKLSATEGGMIMAADLFAMPSTPGEWIGQILAAGVDFGTAYLLYEGAQRLAEDPAPEAPEEPAVQVSDIDSDGGNIVIQIGPNNSSQQNPTTTDNSQANPTDNSNQDNATLNPR
jgi:hypothetical protein